VKEQLFDYGIDSTWNDNNEFEVTQPDARCMGFGREIPISLARPLQTLMMMRASYDIQLENAPDERPFLISRAGAPGMQRYVQTWSGDNRHFLANFEVQHSDGSGLEPLRGCQHRA